MASFISGGYGNDAELLSPVLDLSGMTAPQLSFNHAQVGWSGDVDALDVYYTTDGGVTTTLLASYTSEETSFTERILTLPTSSTLQILFYGDGNWGRGICVDDVVVQETPSCFPPTDVVFSNITATTADIAITDANGGTAIQWSVDYGVGNTSDFNERLVGTPSGTLTGLSRKPHMT